MVTSAIIALPCLALATLLSGASPALPTALTHRLVSSVQHDAPRDAGFATDTTPPLLTTELLARITHFLAEGHVLTAWGKSASPRRRPCVGNVLLL